VKVAVILPAAGQSKRFNESGSGGGGKSKLEVELAGKPVFLHAIDSFTNRDDVSQIIIAVDPDRIDDFRFRYGDKLAFHGIKVVAGGRVDRWETVMNALKEIDDEATHVAVHDAARPLVTKKLINRVFEAAQMYPAVIPATPVSATLKRVDAEAQKPADEDPLDQILGKAGKTVESVRRVIATVDRANLVAVQTPQVFDRELLQKAYDQITSGNLDAAGITDDAALIESLGESVMVVDGESTNIKITVQEDLELATAIADKRKQATTADLAKKRLFGDDDDE